MFDVVKGMIKVLRLNFLRYTSKTDIIHRQAPEF